METILALNSQRTPRAVTEGVCHALPTKHRYLKLAPYILNLFIPSITYRVINKLSLLSFINSCQLMVYLVLDAVIR